MIGKVLDGSAVAALVGNSLEAGAWLDTAYALATSFYVPALAFAEVRTLHPELLADLDDLRDHPSIMAKDMTRAERAAVQQLLTDAGEAFDVLAGQVVHIAVTRGWPALTADPGRLRRFEPDIELNIPPSSV